MEGSATSSFPRDTPKPRPNPGTGIPTWRGHQVAHQFISGDEREDSIMEGLFVDFHEEHKTHSRDNQLVLRLDRRNQWMQRFPARNVIMDGEEIALFGTQLTKGDRIVVIGHWDPAPFKSGSKFHCTSMLILDRPGTPHKNVVEVPANLAKV